MKELYYTVADEVFAEFPGYVRGIVIARGLTNGPSPDELTSLLREAEESLRRELGTGNPADHPRIASWREAFRKLGMKPAEFRSSIEAMARRVAKGHELPSINALVDLGNALSLLHLLPCGGHSLDDVSGDIMLRPARGDEVFVPFGETEAESPAPREFIFAEGDQVLTRRWCWRQANHTLTLPETRDFIFNVDGMPPVGADEVLEVCREMEELMARFCGGESFRTGLLSSSSPRASLS
ncbi:MAG: phenylalanine--tRNA ligase beta subunit-related protein [Synergistota bacterium]|nr:phenylalanine--tRNA ligase beta subunit-related protein [Synergistota bacterium]